MHRNKFPNNNRKTRLLKDQFKQKLRSPTSGYGKNRLSNDKTTKGRGTAKILQTKIARRVYWKINSGKISKIQSPDMAKISWPRGCKGKTPKRTCKKKRSASPFIIVMKRSTLRKCTAFSPRGEHVWGVTLATALPPNSRGGVSKVRLEKNSRKKLRQVELWRRNPKRTGGIHRNKIPDKRRHHFPLKRGGWGRSIASRTSRVISEHFCMCKRLGKQRK